MLVDQEDPTGVKLVSPETDPVALDIAPGGIWGGSPDGDQVLLISANAAEFRSFNDDGLEPESTLVAVDGSLGQGAWSPDGSIVAGVLLGAPEGGIPKTELVTIAAETSEGNRVRIVPNSSGTAGQVVWSEDGESLVYVKSAPPRDLNLQAILCARPPEGRCESLFTWKRGVTLLHLY